MRRWAFIGDLVLFLHAHLHFAARVAIDEEIGAFESLSLVADHIDLRLDLSWVLLIRSEND
jgi:hypothetical protein